MHVANTVCVVATAMVVAAVVAVAVVVAGPYPAGVADMVTVVPIGVAGPGHCCLNPAGSGP